LTLPAAMAIVDSAEAGLRAAPRATILQLRAPGLTTRRLEVEAIELDRRWAVPVIDSSRVDGAVAAGAAGVNLPERDVGIEFARGLVRRRLVGKSVHTLEGASRAQDEGADFVIFGPVWETASHPGVAPAGIDELARVAANVRIPVLAIGGVTVARVAEVQAAGAAGYAAISMYAS
jgi:thiamine-phosphate pyrophosphorylase